MKARSRTTPACAPAARGRAPDSAAAPGSSAARPARGSEPRVLLAAVDGARGRARFRARQEEPAMRAAHELIAHRVRLGRAWHGGTAQRATDEPRRHHDEQDQYEDLTHRP